MAYNPFGLNDPYANLRTSGTNPAQNQNASGGGANSATAALANNPGAPKGGNPFADMLSHVTAFNGAMTPQTKMAAPGMTSSAIVNGPDNRTQDGGGGGGALPGGGGAPPGGPVPGAPPVSTPPGPTGWQEGPAAAIPTGGGRRPAADPAGGQTGKPAGTEDPAIAAQWYSQWIPGITAADVTEFRNWELQRLAAGAAPTRIEDWWKNGKPMAYRGQGQGNGQAQGGPPPGWQGYPGQNEPPKPTLPSPGEEPGTGIGPAPGENPTTSPETPVEGWVDPLAAQEGALRKFLDPMWERQSSEMTRRMRAQAALTGQQDSGGFGENLGQAQAELSGLQGQQMGDYLFQAQQASLDRNQQWAIAKMQDDLARYGIQTNADLQKYLQANELELQKYGIDVQDLWQRYQADMQFKGVQLNASAQIQVGQLMSAAQASVGGMASSASRYNSDLDYALGLANLDVGRENNFMDFYTAMASLGPDFLRAIFGASADTIIGGFNPFGDTVVKP